MPLRILLAAIGSSGDVNPVLGLGKALKARGHRVSLATNEIFEGLVRESGLEFIELGTLKEAEAMMGDPRLWHRRRGFHCIVEGPSFPISGGSTVSSRSGRDRARSSRPPPSAWAPG